MEGPAPPPGGFRPPPQPMQPPQFGAQPPPYAPPLPPHYGMPAPATDGRAIASLGLAAASVVTCMGAFAGIPAVVLGIVALRDIARSQGMRGGKGLAISGIAIGGISSTLTLLSFLWMFALPSAKIFGGGTITAPTYAPPPAPTVAHDYVGSAEVHRAEGANLTTILVDEVEAAKMSGRTLLVQTVGRTVCPRSCPEIRRALRDQALQDLFMHRAVLLEVGIERYGVELSRMGVPTSAAPMFFLVGSGGRVTDLISADQWDDNTSYNIAPVLEDFVSGTLQSRRIPDPRRNPASDPSASSAPTAPTPTAIPPRVPPGLGEQRRLSPKKDSLKL